jgi:hypothetical protein
LHRHGAGDRFDHRRESEQQAVAGCLDDLSLMGGDERIDEFLAVGFQRRERTLLVRAHESRVADDIGGDDRSKMTLYRRRRHNRDPGSVEKGVAL